MSETYTFEKISQEGPGGINVSAVFTSEAEGVNTITLDIAYIIAYLDNKFGDIVFHHYAGGETYKEFIRKQMEKIGEVELVKARRAAPSASAILKSLLL